MGDVTALKKRKLQIHRKRRLERNKEKLKELRRKTCDRLLKTLRRDIVDVGTTLCAPSQSKRERINWESLPKSIDPTRWHEDLDTCRGQRKRWQIESIVRVLGPMIKRLRAEKKGTKNLRVVDFGSGSGNLGLCCAALFPKCTLVLVDMNKISIEFAKKKAKEAGLDNVETVACRIEEYSASFDACISLHACGNASDFAQALALHWNAAYIMAPCCVGKLNHSFKLIDGFERAETVSSSVSSTIPPRDDADFDLVAWYDTLHRTQLLHLLEFNGIKQCARKKLELARRCADMDAKGVPRSCSKCGTGRMKPVEGAYRCMNYHYCLIQKRRIYCGYVTNSEIPRVPWKLPTGLRRRRLIAASEMSTTTQCASEKGDPECSDGDGAKVDTGARSLARVVCSQLQHPRSKLCRAHCTSEEFVALSKGADHNAIEMNDCKYIIECDRNAAARECNFVTVIGQMYPSACTNKRDVLVGIPAHLSDLVDNLRTAASLAADGKATVGKCHRDRSLLAFVRSRAVRGNPPSSGRCAEFLPLKWQFCGRRVRRASETCASTPPKKQRRCEIHEREEPKAGIGLPV
eukprot:g2191.t1